MVGEEKFGVKLDNGTYTGALGLLQSGKGHLYLKVISLLVNISNISF